MVSPAADKKAEIQKLANAISLDRDCDVLVFNFGLEYGFDLAFHRFLNNRRSKKKNLLLFITTEGGDADAAYRIGRYLQQNYENGIISIAVCGWCKSAGTLVCIAAHELILFDTGELGPLDVQIVKADELGEVSSGLLAEAAFDKLQQEAFRMFERHLTSIKKEIGGRITFKTAADISAQLVVGVMKDIFAKIEPMSVAEDYRSNLIAGEYARRLNLVAHNLQDGHEPKALDMLLNGYPSHRFVIDRKEAENLFHRVSTPSSDMIQLAELLGMDVILPRSMSRNQKPRLEYLNDETTQVSKAKAAPKVRGPHKPPKTGGARAADLPGGVPEGPEQEVRLKPVA